MSDNLYEFFFLSYVIGELNLDQLDKRVKDFFQKVVLLRMKL